MKIRCWGARGSIPVSGREHLKYGGDSTCIEVIGQDGRTIIIDSGTGIRRLGNQALADGRFEFDLIFTHAHWDHLLGFPFFKPLYNKKTKISIYGSVHAQQTIRRIIEHTMEAPYFPVDLNAASAEVIFSDLSGVPIELGTIHVDPILLSHPNGGFGYRFIENGKTFVFLTDNELEQVHPQGKSYVDYLAFSKGADVLIHDAEYTEKEYASRTKGWGHSSYRKALEFALEAGVKQFGLFHHNQDRSDDEIDAIVADCREIIARTGSKMICYAVAQDQEIVI